MTRFKLDRTPREPGSGSFLVLLVLLLAVMAAGFVTRARGAEETAILDALPRLTPVFKEYLPGRKLAVFFPPERELSPVPVIVLVHGGGWSAGKPELLELHARYFASRGWVAVTVEYRLATDAENTVFQSISDVKAAIRWVRTHAGELGVIPSQIIAAGDSAGGHLVACAGGIEGLEADGQNLDVSSKPDAMILWYPILDTTAPDGWDLARLSGSAGRAVASRSAEISPVDHVKTGVPPALIVHGAADDLTPIAWSEAFAQQMKMHGNSVELVRLPDQKHAFMTRGYGSDATLLAVLVQSEQFVRALGTKSASHP